MHITSAMEDFQEIAARLRFQSEDLVPVEKREDWWRVSPQLLLQKPELIDLTRLYNQTKISDITQRAKSRRRRISLKTGPDLLLISGRLSTRPNELFVGIRVPQPLELQSGPLQVLEHKEKTDTETSMREGPPKSSNNATSPASRPTCQEEISRSGDQRPCAASENQGRVDKAAGDSITEGRILSALREMPDLTIRNVTGVRSLPVLRVGDILELDGLEEIRVKSGVLTVLGMGYREEEIVDER